MLTKGVGVGVGVGAARNAFRTDSVVLSEPLKLLLVETVMLVVLAGAASGVTVVSPLSGTVVSG